MKCTRVWYADGDIREASTRKEWGQLPQFDVVCVAQKGHYPMAGDYYWVDEDGIVNSEIAGRAMARRFKTSVDGLDSVKEVKQGVTVGFNEWRRLQAEAMAWGREDCGCAD